MADMADEHHQLPLNAAEAARIEDMLSGAMATNYWGHFEERPDLMAECQVLLDRLINFQKEHWMPDPA